MNRFKFRFWNKEYEVMINKETMGTIRENILKIPKEDKIYKMWRNDWLFSVEDPEQFAFELCYKLEFEENDSIIIMQFTGLKDIYGKEIYEGDIVMWGHINTTECPPIIAIVEFKPDIQFKPINLKSSAPFYYGGFVYKDTEKYLEVIGNIYENPKLIEQNSND